MLNLKIGELLKPGVTRYPEGCRFGMSDVGGELLITLSNLSAWELHDYMEGRVQYGYYRENNVIFMLFKFGERQWLDCPYSVHLSRKLTKLEDIEDGKGYSITIYLVDASTGILKGIRLISMNTRASKMFKKDIEKQKSMSFDNYDININSIYNKLSTKDMVKRADIICKLE